jgi:hypothetical protein
MAGHMYGMKSTGTYIVQVMIMYTDMSGLKQWSWVLQHQGGGTATWQVQAED